MVKIFFEAHSTTIDNEAGRASGWNDVDLSELGLKQSEELKERYLDRQIDAIFPSDLQRAVKTAVPLASANHIPMYPDARLRECDYGDLTQAPKSEVDSQRADRVTTPFPNGESYQDCMKRMGDFLEWLKEGFEGQTVLIIGSRATHFGLDHHINGMDITDAVSQKFVWQPGWQYELT